MALDKKVFEFLKKHNTDTHIINSLIVSNFLSSKNFHQVNNEHINSLLIKNNSANSIILEQLIDIQQIENFEELIEAFEYVISPADKIVNGAIYTPSYIRDYIVNNCISRSNINIENLKISDISCGCGGFLLTTVRYIKQNTAKAYRQIFAENIYGVDIEEYSIERTKILLALEAILNGEDNISFQFNLYQGNSLDFDWKARHSELLKSQGFDIIVGNPPYVSSRNMDAATMKLLENIEVSRSGHPDLYIPFFQIGIENLNPNGILGYITVNTFIKSINGRALRSYFSKKALSLTILNFGGEQLFKDRNTYTCICFLSFNNGIIKYMRIKSADLSKKTQFNFAEYEYANLDNESGWNLVNQTSLHEYINKIEATGTPFSKQYTTRNGIATLKNNVYKFTPIREDDEFYYLNDNATIYPIERKICRDIVNANKIKVHADIANICEKIIFPYDNDSKIIPEKKFIKQFPKAHKYLETKQEILNERDKKMGKYEEWYAYGRRQSLDINKYKLFFPHICQRPTFVICDDKDLLFYNGIAVVSDSIEKLTVLKKILESDVFYKYIRATTKDYASGYISMSKNYIKNFGVVDLTTVQKQAILNEVNANEFLLKLYDVTTEFDYSEYN